MARDDDRTPPRPNRPNRRLTAGRWLAAALFVAAGVNHFRRPDVYRLIVPPGLPRPDLLVAVSGACEVAGGLGLLVRRLRRPAGWGLIALLVAVFPANVFMAVSPDRAGWSGVPPWALWLRLPLQPVLMAWVWLVSVGRRTTEVHPPAR